MTNKPDYLTLVESEPISEPAAEPVDKDERLTQINEEIEKLQNELKELEPELETTETRPFSIFNLPPPEMWGQFMKHGPLGRKPKPIEPMGITLESLHRYDKK